MWTRAQSGTLNDRPSFTPVICPVAHRGTGTSHAFQLPWYRFNDDHLHFIPEGVATALKRSYQMLCTVSKLDPREGQLQTAIVRQRF